jgi:DNA polymerase-3 subunit epsilon
MIEKVSKHIKLDKPLVIFDLETTGLVITTDRIIQVAYEKLMPNGRVIKGDFLINPEMDIPTESIEIHGITNNMVVDKPSFKNKSKELWDIFNDCYYAGFNILRFDLPILRREFLRVGMDFDYKPNQVIDSKVIYHYMEPRSLTNAYKYYCGKKHKDRHNAVGDLKATTDVLIKQLKKYSYEFIEKIHAENEEKYFGHERKFYWRKGEPYFSFSRFEDKALSDVVKSNPGFLRWMLSANFPDTVKNVVKKALGSEDKKSNKKDI